MVAAAKPLTNRTNPIGNFYVDKIDGEVMHTYLIAQKVPGDVVDPEGTDEQLAVRLSIFFKEQLANGACAELFECEICNGATPDTCETCPLCGNGGEILAAAASAPASDPTAIDAVQMGVGDPEPLPPPTPIRPAAANVGGANPKKKSSGATKPEDAPRRDVSPPPADPKKKEEPMAAATTSTSKKGSKANGSTALAKGASVEIVKTADDLDKAVLRVEKLKADTQFSFWALGRELLDINEHKLWKLRTDKDGKARYTGWDSFVTHELKMSAPHSYDLIKLAQNYTEQQVMKFGRTKLAMIIKAPPDARDELLADVEAGASKRDIETKVNKKRKETGYQSAEPRAKGGKASGKKQAAKRALAKKDTDKITIASIEGRKSFKFFAKPDSLKGVDTKTLKRAKTIDASPFARIEMANEVVMYLFIKKTENGLEGTYDIRREAAE